MADFAMGLTARELGIVLRGIANAAEAHQHVRKQKNENYENTEIDDASAEKEAEADCMHPTSCSGSFEWDVIPERNEEMDVKSKPKEEKFSNEVRHDHQQGVSFGIVNSNSSTAYEGFGMVVDSSSLSRKESMDESYDWPDGRDRFLPGGTRATPVLGIASLRCDCSHNPLECRKRKTKAMSADYEPRGPLGLDL
jgi:hypothetical protein